MKDDELPFIKNESYSTILNKSDFVALPWSADIHSFYSYENIIRITEGAELSNLSDVSREILTSSRFIISSNSDRMGYRLSGDTLELTRNEELVSSAVTLGTLQLLPNGQIIILMADHQTTGGYPRMAHVITADIPKLAQMNFNESIRFQTVSIEEAENLFLQQQKNLNHLQQACSLQLNKYLDEKIKAKQTSEK